MKTLAFGAFAVAMLAGSAAAAQDQNFGPAIPGVCIYHHDRLMAQSTAGQSLVAGVQRLQQEVQTELAPYEQFIQTERQALQQGQATIPQDQFQQRAEALDARYREFEGLRQTRTAEMRYTLAYQQQQIGQAVDPIHERADRQGRQSLEEPRIGASAHVTGPVEPEPPCARRPAATAAPRSGAGSPFR